MAAASDSTPALNSRPTSLLAGISRDRLSEAIERLIAVLDALDGDCDLEGSPAVLNGRIIACVDIDCEEEPDAEPDEDGEPTLGWPNNVGMGAATLSTGWRSQFAGLDGEYEPNDRPVRGGAAL